MRLKCTATFVYMPRHKLPNGHIWASSSEQEVGAIGWLRVVVGACVIDQRGGEAVCSMPMCLSLFITTRGQYIIRAVACKAEPECADEE